MRLRAATAAFFVASLAPSLARAQNAPLSSNGAEQAARPHKDATASSIVRMPDVAVSFTGSKGEKKVQGRVGVAVGDWTFDGKLEGPLDQGQPDTNLATLDGLTNATTFEAGLSHLSWKPSADSVRQQALCEAFRRSQVKKLDEAEKIATGGPAPLVCDLLGLPKESFRDQYLNAPTNARRKEVCAAYALTLLEDPEKFECDPEKMPRRSLAEEWDAATNWSLPLALGARWTIGRSKFKWAETTTGDLKSEGETPWAIGAGGNILFDRGYVFSLEYRHQSDYEEQSKRQVCQPIAGSAGATTCRELPFGRYKHEVRDLATASVRKWFASAAAEFRYSFDLKTSIHSVEIPVYFLTAEGKGLTGGVAAGWTSKKDTVREGWSMRAFIGDVLALWPNQ